MSTPTFIQRRGEVIAELFLGDLRPITLVQVPQSDEVCDFFAAFRTKQGKVLTIGVEAIATDKPVPAEYVFHASGRRLEMLVASTLPLLLVVVDVKLNEVFFNWTTNLTVVRDPSVRKSALLRLPVIKATEESKASLLKEIKSK
jgi:hypothetical protein